jgi:hypothetical protein
MRIEVISWHVMPMLRCFAMNFASKLRAQIRMLAV